MHDFRQSSTYLNIARLFVFFDWKKSVEFHKQRHSNTAITVATEPRFRTILS